MTENGVLWETLETIARNSRKCRKAKRRKCGEGAKKQGAAKHSRMPVFEKKPGKNRRNRVLGGAAEEG